MQPVRHPARRQPLHRGGFSLIELMIVVVIIAILAALLFPALRGAIQNAREATVVVEIASFDKAMVDFKNRYGAEVPSFLVLYEQGDDGSADPSWFADTSSTNLPGTQDAYRRTSKALIRQIWPDFDFTYGGGGTIDINGNGSIDSDPLILDGSECLVFFLGGVFTRGTNNGTIISGGLKDDALVGFAANPQNPFDATSTNNRVGPFVDNFLVDRFTDVDGDNMPEYRDGLTGQQRPYVYVSSYGGSGYKVWGLDTTQGTTDDEIPLSIGMTDAYRKDDGTATGPYLNLQTYQIISPGSDTELGAGGPYNGNGVPSARANERDNIANFKGGRLN